MNLFFGTSCHPEKKNLCWKGKCSHDYFSCWNCLIPVRQPKTNKIINFKFQALTFRTRREISFRRKLLKTKATFHQRRENVFLSRRRHPLSHFDDEISIFSNTKRKWIDFTAFEIWPSPWICIDDSDTLLSTKSKLLSRTPRDFRNPEISEIHPVRRV